MNTVFKDSIGGMDYTLDEEHSGYLKITRTNSVGTTDMWIPKSLVFAYVRDHMAKKIDALLTKVFT